VGTTSSSSSSAVKPPSSSSTIGSTRISSTTSTTSTTSASATSSCYYWYENITHLGKAPFNSNSSYTVFRNVKNFGAKGDGTTDDTAAINAAISSGNRCAPGTCASSLLTPAVVYFPAGTYVVSQPIIDYYFTQIIGNPNCMPVIKASASFTGAWVIDGDQYQSTGNLGYGATNIFWRQIRNLVIDMTAVSPNTLLRGVHWPTGQATSLQNLVFKMSAVPGTQHEGLFIESGSGGFITDLVFNGGNIGANIGNQQFTMRNFTFNNCVTAVNQLYSWGWTYQGFTISGCSIGFNISASTGGIIGVGSITLIDSFITNTPIGVLTARGSNPNPPSGDSLIIENVKLNNVPKAVVLSTTNAVLLTGTTGTTTIAGWAQGHSYTSTSGPTNLQGAITPNIRPASLVTNGAYYTRSKPQYQNLAASQFVSARYSGAAGDGVTDDTAAVQATINNALATERVAYFDAGIYKVTGTITIPAGAQIVGECYPVIMSSGSFFSNMSNPQPVVQVGTAGSTGSVEWSDMIVSSQGAQAGAILIQWNLASSTPSGMWDVHTRVGGFQGSNLQVAQCPKTPNTVVTNSNLNTNCIAAFASMHIAKTASGVYMENVWLWTADHDVEDASLTQITVYSGRGLLIESTSGTLWLVGTAVEHHVMYEYELANTQNIYMGFIQTETAYYQPNPPAPIPFPSLSAWNDPTFSTSSNSTNNSDGWGLRVVSSNNVFIYGAGLYSFFSNYNVTCSNQGNGEACQNRILSVENSTAFNLYDLSTVGVTNMITVNGNDVAKYSDNLNGFIDTIILFRL
jgi:glucan 1,3-beta-glucosidase